MYISHSVLLFLVFFKRKIYRHILNKVSKFKFNVSSFSSFRFVDRRTEMVPRRGRLSKKFLFEFFIEKVSRVVRDVLTIAKGDC